MTPFCFSVHPECACVCVCVLQEVAWMSIADCFPSGRTPDGRTYFTYYSTVNIPAMVLIVVPLVFSCPLGCEAPPHAC